MERISHLGTVPRESTVSVQVAAGLAEVVEMAGIPRRQLLRAAQLEPTALDTPDARLARGQVYRLCQLAMDLTADRALGLHWAERVNANAFTPISHLLAHAANLRQALEALSQYRKLLADQSSYELVEDGRHVVIRCLGLPGEAPPVQRFLAEMLVTGMYLLVRSFDAHRRPERVSFEYTAPAHQAEYARVFAGAERFEQPFTGLVFDRALMDAPSPHRDEDVHVALRSIVERRIMRLTQRTPYSARVRELLVQYGPDCRADMETVARALGLSARSLRRRLEAEGTSFSSAVSEAQQIVAKQLLRATQHSIQEIAYDMGFADATAFHRAFKRWTGLTPRGYREAQSHSEL